MIEVFVCQLKGCLEIERLSIVCLVKVLLKGELA